MRKKSIYVMQSGGRCKIGVSMFPERRLEQVRIGNPDIVLVWSSVGIFNANEIECCVHKMFEPLSCGKEWFMVADIGDFIDKIKLEVDERGVREWEDKESVRGDAERKIMELIIGRYGEIEKGTLEKKLENEQLEKFEKSISGLDIENVLSDAIYENIFHKSLVELQKEYTLGKYESFRNRIPEDKLKKVEALQKVVVGLINWNWSVDKIADFIRNMDSVEM